MVKPALAAARAVTVLDFLALHPGQAFSLKELSGACQVNGASLLAVVTALVDGGYLLRHPNHKTYTIGPGVVSLAHAALVQHPTIDAARHLLPDLADDLEAHCTATVLMGDTLVSVAMAGTARRAATWTQTGMRMPFSAPFGAPFVAFGSPGIEVEWLGAVRSGSVTRARNLERALEDIRTRGYSVVEEQAAREELGHVLQALAEAPGDEDRRRRMDALLVDLSASLLDLRKERRKKIWVASLSVPVFSPVGDVVMLLTATGFRQALSLDDMADIGQRMTATARSISLDSFGSLGSGDRVRAARA
jgi:DNA-binding IclR family transcriptional regulator